ncbi:precorrin-4 C(11)-methyltransferase [Flammeovirga sp. SJP92]|uniref:precorrin-4 C(11)-methyltransferase n=1 Tax=Flammeovirga sp. SJP92 TaxID=1775430 RepID=UPI0007899629|nr:precorrin-4 C(11)-methyltransferase [Flammeovirga sp. SJP92]KXX68392.1 cobalamin biosynthesis protein CbiG [Flammeovirga sp. SJP92]
MNKIAIIATTDRGLEQALILQKEFPKSLVVTTRETDNEHVSVVASLSDYLSNYYHKLDGICFVSALGICVRLIAPYIETKATDPAVVCMDDHGKNIQSVLSGHQGGANQFAEKIAQVVGGKAIISTSSDLQEIWALDTLSQTYDWTVETDQPLNHLISLFVNNQPTALLLDVKDKGTAYLEKNLPEFVTVFYDAEEIVAEQFELLIAVTYKIYDFNLPSLYYRPKVLALGSGCSKTLDFPLFEARLKVELEEQKIAFSALKTFGSIDIKAQQSAYLDFSNKYYLPFVTFSKEAIDEVKVPNPSEMVQSKIGVDGVSESTAMLLSKQNKVLVEKTKIHLENDDKFTYSIALIKDFERRSAVAIIGAGPGDEELITVKGKQYLEEADCVLYAGSLVPEEMISWCKEGAIVRNSAMMTLEEQVSLMFDQYKKGNAIVRLHCGDPSLYGAIQEQMTIFDELGMDYFIVPGISSFSAAAAALKSEFTIPEVVQSIVLTRGEGKTPMPAKESVEAFAKTNATMCLFLSAGIAKKVQAQLLNHFDENTPVAVMYRLTWKDEEIYQGQLKDLAQIVKDSKKTRTVLIVVGKAIGARKNRSQLYNPDWQHIFRTNKKFVVKEA